MHIQDETKTRVEKLHQHGLVDMHFDLLMDLYEKRHRENVMETDHLPALVAGNVGVLGAAIYLEDRYLPEMRQRVALDQIALLYSEADRNHQLGVCHSYADILQARQGGQIAMLITMEGVEPLGEDLHLLRVFYELGLRSLGLTHARRNAAGVGAAFAPFSSSSAGLTPFGRQVVEGCEELGIIIDLAHLNPAGFQQVMAITTRPPIISHTNPRRFYDLERNSSDEQMRLVAERGGVVGISSVLLSPDKDWVHLDHYVEHIEYVAELVGIDGVGLGCDFFEFIYDTLPEAVKASLPEVHFIPDFHHHAHTPNLTRKLVERGFSDDEIGKIYYGNFMRVFREVL